MAATPASAADKGRGGSVVSAAGGAIRLSLRLADTLLAEFCQEHRTPLLERGDLSPELFKLPVDARQFGPRLPLPEVPLTTSGADQFLDLTAEQPQPRVPVHRSRTVLQLARPDRRDDFVLRQPELRPSRLVAQRRALAPPFIAVQLHNRSLSRRAAPASRRSRVYRRLPMASSSKRSPITDTPGRGSRS